MTCGSTEQYNTVVYRRKVQYVYEPTRVEARRNDLEDDCGDVGVQQMTDVVCPVVQGLLAVGGMRPWCGAVVGLPSIRF